MKNSTVSFLGNPLYVGTYVDQIYIKLTACNGKEYIMES